MRIIGGKLKGRRFYPPADKWPTRPTTDYAKESLFNILTNQIDFEDIKALDLYGGTGSHTYELVSRGCNDVTYVDKFANAVKFVREAVGILKIEQQVHIIQMDVFKFLGSAAGPFDYIFADPPYDLPALDTIPDKVLSSGLLATDGLFVLEHGLNHIFVHHPNLIDVRKYGKTTLSFFSAVPQDQSSDVAE